MSLILEALKKLEREKQAPDRGFLIVPHAPWPGRGKRLGLVAGLIAVALAGAGAGWWLASQPQRQAPGSTESPGSEAPVATAAAPAQSDELGVPPPPGPLPEPRGSQRAVAPVDIAEEPATGTPQPPADTGPDAPIGEPLPAEPEASKPSAGPPDTALSQTPAGAPGAPTPASFVLHAIGERDGRPVAMLNERLVFEGDSFDGVRVLRIGATEVELEIDGERRVIGF